MPAKKSPQKPKKTKEDSHNNNKNNNNNSDDDNNNDPDMSAFMGHARIEDKYFNKNYHREFMAKLPEKIRDRTKLLLSLDNIYMSKYNDYNNNINNIKIKYEALYQPLWARRRDIINGNSDEITEEEILEGYPEDHKGQVDINNNNNIKEEEKKGDEK
eukprot:Tbor_TRINITY_DN5703_c6_g1::TRINITY_DN5703_c6_g1_i1::g.21021::m.21021